MGHKTDIVTILALVIPVSYKCRSDIEVPYINTHLMSIVIL